VAAAAASWDSGCPAGRPATGSVVSQHHIKANQMSLKPPVVFPSSAAGALSSNLKRSRPAGRRRRASSAGCDGQH
jgi:hypothetical protein